MIDPNETPLIARLLGLNWQTTLGGALAAAGGVLATQCTGNWRVIGGVMLAIGLAWTGASARDRNVSSAQMDQAKQDAAAAPPPKVPPAALVLLLVCGLLVAGCGTVILNVNILGNQTRMAQAQGTNTVRQAIEGGGSASSNALTATIPLK